MKRKTGKTERKMKHLKNQKRKDREKDGTFDKSKTEQNDGNAKHLTNQKQKRQNRMMEHLTNQKQERQKERWNI
jgi:hypothetical protein